MKTIIRQTIHWTSCTSVIRTLTILALLAAMISVSRAADIFWTNGTASYNNATHWSPNQIPGAADNAINNNGTNNAVQINAEDPAWTVVDVMAGNDINGPVGGAFTQNGSTLNVNGWMRLGMTTDSTARYTLNAGTLNLSGRMQTGEGADSTTVININGGVIRKSGGGLGLNFSDGGWGGQHSATTLVTQTDGIIHNAGDTWIGQFTGAVATYNLHAGAINSSNWFVVSRAGGMGTLNMDGGTITHVSGGQPAFIVGDRAGTGGGVGLFNFSGGTVTTIGAEYWVGNGEAATGTNNLSGNAALTVDNWMAVGRENSVGVLNLLGNTSVTKTGNGNLVIGTGGGVGGLGIINQNGGVFTMLTGQVWLGENGASTGIWNLNNGQAVLGVLDIAHVASAAGTFNLNGGTLTATEVRKGISSGIATFNFNGGILRAAEDKANFMHSLEVADIQAGGAVIDTQGFDIGIPQILYDYFSTGGGLTKNGAGKLTLTGNNGYSGLTTVNAGKLITSTATAFTGNYSVANGAGFGVLVTFANGQLSPGNVTLGTSGATSLDFDLGAHGNPSFAPLNVTGTLAVNGTVTVNIADELPQIGVFPLIQYGTKTGSGTFVIGSLPTGMQAVIVNNTANNSIDLNITQVDVVRWDGQVNGNWNIGITTNWVNTGNNQPTTYADGNPAIFNDDALGTTLVNITTTVSPNGVTVENDLKEYTFIGSGKISGPVGLTKDGPGPLTILNTGGNDYTGPTRIEGGTLSVTNIANGGSPSAIGASSSSPTNLVLAGGTFRYAGTSASSDRGYSVLGTNNAIQTDGNLSLSGTVSPAPASVFLKTGSGTLAYRKSGTNLLASGGGGGFAAYNAVAGKLLLDGTGGNQTNSITGELWIGGNTNSGAALVMSNSTLISSSWVALGRGNGSDDFLSSVRLENSRIRVTGGGFSAGYDAGLPMDLGIMVLARQQITLNGNSALEVASGPIFIAERRGATATLHLNGNSRMTNSANAGVGIGQGGSFTGSTGLVQIADSALWRVGEWFSIGNDGGTADVRVRNNGSLIVGSDLNVTDVGASTGTLIAQDNAQVFANVIFVGKDNNAAGIFTITNNATVLGTNGVIMARHWEGHTVIPTTAILNLAGGSLAVNGVQGSVLDEIPYGTFNFNGGRLNARNPTGANFMFNLASINVQAGGAVIDSDTFNIAITQPLLNGGGGGGLTKLGTGALYLNGDNTYTGTTLVNAGTLGGTGVISGPVSVAVGGTLAPGPFIGTLTINNTLNLAGTTVVEISREGGAPQSDRVTGVTTLTYGGTLVVTSIGASALQLNDTFHLFNASFINPATFTAFQLPAGYTWNTSQLTVNGTISVSGVAPAQPEFNPPTITGGNMILTGTGGSPGAPYVVLSSTNVAAPLIDWTTSATGNFSGTGAYSNAVPINPTDPRRFYLLRAP